MSSLITYFGNDNSDKITYYRLLFINQSVCRYEINVDIFISWSAEGGQVSDVLMAVGVNIIDMNVCKNNYIKETLTGMICAGMPGGGKDACQVKHPFTH